MQTLQFTQPQQEAVEIGCGNREGTAAAAADELEIEPGFGEPLELLMGNTHPHRLAAAADFFTFFRTIVGLTVYDDGVQLFPVAVGLLQKQPVVGDDHNVYLVPPGWSLLFQRHEGAQQIGVDGGIVARENQRADDHRNAEGVIGFDFRMLIHGRRIGRRRAGSAVYLRALLGATQH